MKVKHDPMNSPNPLSHGIIMVTLASCLIPFSAQSQSTFATASALTIHSREVESSKAPFVTPEGHRLPDALPLPKTRKNLPSVFSPSVPRDGLSARRFTTFPWKNDIVTTVFWIGEKAAPKNPVPNTASSWDPKWSRTFGGFDDPNSKNRKGWLPKKFVPKQNPFYIALPYNDTAKLKTKATARKHVPWFEQAYYRDGKSVLKGRWVAVRRGDKVCYGQWEDCGPFETDNWEYVFGDQRPRTKGNGGAGLDVSPAMRDYLGFKWNARCDWRFVELYEIPNGPWKTWGNNNPVCASWQ